MTTDPLPPLVPPENHLIVRKYATHTSPMINNDWSVNYRKGIIFEFLCWIDRCSSLSHFISIAFHPWLSFLGYFLRENSEFMASWLRLYFQVTESLWKRERRRFSRYLISIYNAETISGLRRRVNILGVTASFLSRARFNKHYTLFRLRREVGGGGAEGVLFFNS